MPVLIGDFGDYDRWKSDPDWGVREEKCEHCGGVKHECDRHYCKRCESPGCSNIMLEENEHWICHPKDGQGCSPSNWRAVR